MRKTEGSELCINSTLASLRSPKSAGGQSVIAIKVGYVLVTVEEQLEAACTQWPVSEEDHGSRGRLIGAGTTARLELAGAGAGSSCLVEARQIGVAEARHLQRDNGLPLVAWEDAVFGWSPSHNSLHTS